MATKKRVRGNPIPLIVEEHPADYSGYPFITLIQYRNDHVLSIVDNATDKVIKAYILDMCGPAQVNEEQVIGIAASWYETNREQFPLSIEFSRLGLTSEVKNIYRTLNIEFVTRVIGPLPRFEMSEVHSVKRRRRKAVPAGTNVQKKILQVR